jgi:hypothetical protein
MLEFTLVHGGSAKKYQALNERNYLSQVCGDGF